MDSVKLPGIVPYITEADLDKLDPFDYALVQEELARAVGEPLAYQDALRPKQIRILMDVLGVTPVWGRDGMPVYRMNINERVLVFALVPDPALDTVDPEALTREWVECETLPELIEKMDAYAMGVRALEGHAPVIEPEDHPEENAIGFIAPESNRVWLLSCPQVLKDLEADNTGGWAQVSHMIQSNQGRVALAGCIAQGQLLSREQFEAQWALSEGAPSDTLGGRRRSDIIIDLLSGQLATRFKNRYLKKGPNAPEA